MKMTKFPPINAKFPHFWHGGDYNPDQWDDEILRRDMELMKLAHVNVQTVGVFSWARLEPAEGQFDFGWLDRSLDMLAKNGFFAVLATPTAAHPAWMSKKYPEVLRVLPNRQRMLHGNRVTYCPTSPIYREKIALVAEKLAPRYKDHPAVVLWHVSNEIGNTIEKGACYCELCAAAFRIWLRDKYGNLDKLNHAWWTAFWSHTFTDWDQIEAPGVPLGETVIHGLDLDWLRFVTHQNVQVYRAEADILHRISPQVPVTTNFMCPEPLDYWRFTPYLDVAAFDSYPLYHDRPGDWKLAAGVSMTMDLYRNFKQGRPWMLMESTPSSANWMPAMKLKRPGIHRLASLQAVAHGADTVQYFQWRKGRGGAEKFHGAIVDHSGSPEARVFQDVAEVGQILKKLDPVIGAGGQPEVGLIFDYENAWTIDTVLGPRRQGKDYRPTCEAHYRPFWGRGVPVDVINREQPLDKYKLVIAPMLYSLPAATARRLSDFVRGGGTLVTTYWSGIADENDLVFAGGFLEPLREVLGIRSEEIDALYDDEKNELAPTADNPLRLAGRYEARQLCELIHAGAARVLATYGRDFYAGRPALTVNQFGGGRAYYIACRTEDRFLQDFYGRLIADLKLPRVLPVDLPEGVTAQLRTDGTRKFIFLLNFTRGSFKSAISRP